MNFLSAVGAKVIEWILSKIWAVVSAAIQKYQREKKIDDESTDSVEPLKDAKTGAEIDKATDTALDKF